MLGQRQGRGRAIIPFRDSKLTQLLMDSLRTKEGLVYGVSVAHQILSMEDAAGFFSIEASCDCTADTINHIRELVFGVISSLCRRGPAKELVHGVGEVLLLDDPAQQVLRLKHQQLQTP